MESSLSRLTAPTRTLPVVVAPHKTQGANALCASPGSGERHKRKCCGDLVPPLTNPSPRNHLGAILWGLLLLQTPQRKVATMRAPAPH